LIPTGDLELLRTFNSRGHIALSVYLRLDSPELREAAYEEYVRQAGICLEACGANVECRKAIQEDVDIAGLYLRTNGHRRHPGLALFSCAAELFWRAYPLAQPVATRVTAGATFNLEPIS
jgi:hypothetical protein